MYDSMNEKALLLGNRLKIKAFGLHLLPTKHLECVVADNVTQICLYRQEDSTASCSNLLRSQVHLAKYCGCLSQAIQLAPASLHRQHGHGNGDRTNKSWGQRERCG